ncbi:S1 family peptidase [Aestuariibaculum lutulentum]|uniref:Serine protease n=1 Tax=Aestuariibaculum lutulentum TaxID=2920935 RepID=A0ABS9RLU2_9FLAO|nr:serine protease [Aestuariibaculum lutulentum]MCH4553099.1 serine protease [Aestuariibaculum lutulentum]
MKNILVLVAVFSSFSLVLKAQEVSYSNWEDLPNRLYDSIVETQKNAHFISIEQLKNNSVSAENETAIEYPKLPKANKKQLTPQKLVKSIRPTSLMICKLKRGFGIHKDFVIIGASAAVLSEDGLCVSNYHVFESIINQGQSIMPQDSLFFAADSKGKVYPITKVLNYSKSADLATFKIDTRGEKLTPVALGNDLEVGSTVHTMTHPNQRAYYYTKGIVARNSSFVNNPWENRCDITADYAKGSSGGPIFDDFGNLVAIVSSTNSIYAGDSNNPEWQMVIKIAVPVSSVKKLIEG